jgi:ADP-ribose pyrophosphatase YjhB (NUDIX family)
MAPAGVEVLLVHPGGPLWARRDAGALSIPKGELEPGEEPRAAALREFSEELGAAAPAGEPRELGSVRSAAARSVGVGARGRVWTNVRVRSASRSFNVPLVTTLLTDDEAQALEVFCTSPRWGYFNSGRWRFHAEQDPPSRELVGVAYYAGSLIAARRGEAVMHLPRADSAAALAAGRVEELCAERHVEASPCDQAVLQATETDVLVAQFIAEDR